MTNNMNLVERLKKFISLEITPIVQNLDTNESLMLNVFEQFKKAGFFSMYLPKQFGGLDLNKDEKIFIQVLFGSEGGAFSFLQVQTSTAAWLLSYANEAVKQIYLPQIASGCLTVGNCTYVMKPTYNAPLCGEKIKGGFLVSGILPLTSGYRMFDQIVSGFIVGEEEYFFLFDFQDQEGLEIGDIIDIFAMKSISTVSVTFSQLFIPEEQVFLVWPKGKFYNHYRKFPPFAYPLGIAKKAQELMRGNKILQNKTIYEKYNNLKNKANMLINDLISNDFICEECTAEIDYKFSEIVKNAIDSVQLSLMISGGVGLLTSSPIQRLYRELTVWLAPKLYPEVLCKVYEGEALEDSIYSKNNACEGMQ